tara:strand:- start:52 stop:210 length:159 start_codon:yes stop_codon:yes gene_type:complete
VRLRQPIARLRVAGLARQHLVRVRARVRVRVRVMARVRVRVRLRPGWRASTW